MYQSPFLPAPSIYILVFVHSLKMPPLNSSLIIKLNKLYGEELWYKCTWAESPPIWWPLLLLPEFSIATTAVPLPPDPTLSTVLADAMVISYSIPYSSLVSCITVSTVPVLFLLVMRSFLLFDLFLGANFLFLGFHVFKNLGWENLSSEANIMHYSLDKKEPCIIISILLQKDITHLEVNDASYFLIYFTCW